MQASVLCVVDCANILGEVPVWDVREQSFYWVDIEGKKNAPLGLLLDGADTSLGHAGAKAVTAVIQEAYIQAFRPAPSMTWWSRP